MNGQIEKISTDLPPDNLQSIRQRISKEKEKASDPHLQEINPAELTEEDLLIWQKLLDNQLSDRDFEAYYRQFFGKNPDQVNRSSRSLAAMISNKLLVNKAEKIIQSKGRKAA